MTAEKYVAAIARKVKCPAKKRAAIREELLSELRIAQEDGETPEEIMARMGSPEAIAREFNENLPQAEKKQYARQRRLAILLAIAACIALAVLAASYFLPRTVPIGTSGIFSEEDVADRMERVIEEFNEGDYAALQEDATAEMQAVLNEEFMREAKEQIAEDWGAFQAFGNAYLAELTQRGQVFAVGQMTASYTNVSVTYTLTFDEDGKLAGFFIK